MKTLRFKWFWPVAVIWILGLTAAYSQMGRVGDRATSRFIDVFSPQGERISYDDHTIPNLPLPFRIGAGSVPGLAQGLSSWA